LQVEVAVELPQEQTRTGSGALDGHGLVLRLKGTKPKDLAFKRATLRLSEEFFEHVVSAGVAPGAAVSAFRFAAHPIQLCETMLRSSDFPAGEEEVCAAVHIGTGEYGGFKMCHATLKGLVGKLVAAGDRPVELLLESAEPRSRLVQLRVVPARLEGPALCVPLGPAPAGASASELRLRVFREVGACGVDTCCGLFLVASLVLPWRWRLAWRCVQAEDFWAATFGFAKDTLLRLPGDFMVLACLVVPWHRAQVWPCLLAEASGPRTALAVACCEDALTALLLTVATSAWWRWPQPPHQSRSPRFCPIRGRCT
jgi:hypothetical protein